MRQRLGQRGELLWIVSRIENDEASAEVERNHQLEERRTRCTRFDDGEKLIETCHEPVVGERRSPDLHALGDRSYERRDDSVVSTSAAMPSPWACSHTQHIDILLDLPPGRCTNPPGDRLLVRGGIPVARDVGGCEDVG